MATVGELDFRAFVEGRKRARAGGVRDGGHDYAYASDQRTRSTFERIKPVELAVAAAVRMWKEFGRGSLLGQAVKVGPDQFPRVHRLLAHCAGSLGIPVPTLYIRSDPRLNAATFGTNEDSFILVHSGLVDHFSDQELLYVLGHECGHIHNRHVVYLTALHYLKHMASLFVRWIIGPATLALNAWSRRAEITCDRAGLLCCGDLDVATRALAKLALGSQKLYEEMNVDAFVAQHEEAKEAVGRFTEIAASHPFLPKRILALRAFARSELFRRHAGLGEGGLAMGEVDERVHEIIKVVG